MKGFNGISKKTPKELYEIKGPTESIWHRSFSEYVGCYKDSDPRDLPQRIHDREVTVKSCTKSCKDLFYRYAALQFSYLCFCGNKRGRYGQLPDWKCSSECTNKKDTHCGGYWSNSIYKTGQHMMHVICSSTPVNINKLWLDTDSSYMF